MPLDAEATEPGSSDHWLRHARSDLALSSVVEPGNEVLPETLCFHAQQAAEKALKAVLVRIGTEFPRTHSLRSLLDLVPDVLKTEPLLESAVGLTDYAVSARYPGESEPISRAELREAIGLARAVVRWAEGVITSLSRR